MKLNRILPTAILAFSYTTAPFLSAEEDHDHAEHEEHAESGDHDGHDHGEHGEEEHGALEAPNGGRILTDIEPHAEFLVTKEGKIQITFLDDDGKTIAPAEQSISLVTGQRSSPTKLAFEKTETGFLSTTALPEGKNLPAIVQVKVAPDAKTKIIRFNINLADCPTCDHLEYACTCAHGEDGHEGHDH